MLKQIIGAIMTLKEKIINGIIDREGGYVNNPDDTGGETNFGITKSKALSCGYRGEMIDLTRQDAFNIYSKEYWDSVCAEQMPDLIAEEVVDTAVNMGVGRASEFLQRALNVFNSKQALYKDIAVDFKIGPATISALNSYLSKRDEKTLAKALNCMQGAKYISLCETSEKNETFLYGWIKNRVIL